MHRVCSFAIRFFAVLSILGLSVPGTALARQPAQQSEPGRQPRFQAVPAEIQAAFDGGMSLDEFIGLNKGRLPAALERIADREVSVIVQMEGEPLAGIYAQQLEQSAQALSAQGQQAYSASLLNAQATVANQVQSAGGQVLAQYTKAYNGLLVRVKFSQLEALRALPGVKAIHRAPLMRLSLANSVAHIRATEVIEELGIDGTGTTIAIIDSGVDYTHAAFGGPGTPGAYEENDPNVVEEGTFPTEKVIGGYDFAGTEYDADSTDPAKYTPKPDPDPLDENGHGTHVAHTAAGQAVGEIGHGVAPGAEIYALKVFGESGTTLLAVNAIEWALDPNQDNDLSDRVDVINMSLGAAFGIADPLNPQTIAIEYAVSAGVVVVASAGNEGDVSYITGDPAAADAAISVAASTTGFWTGPSITIEDGEGLTRTQIIYGPGNFDEETGIFEEAVTAPLAYVGNLPGAEDDLLCEVPEGAENALEGKIAVIQRGSCDFFVKVNNAAALGAVAAIIFNHEEGGNNLVTMIGDPVDIPAGFVARDDGLILVAAEGRTATISAETDVVTQENPHLPADTIAEFSSRGPRGLESIQKPDITAPGVAIFAAKMGSGDKGTSLNGTSMAAPHISGVAALIIQDHPDWTPEQIKAAMMNTAVDLNIGSAEVPRQGAGRVDAFRAVTTDAFAIGDQDQVSLSWGTLEIEENVFQDTKSIVVHDLSGEDRTFDVSVEWGENSLEAGVTLTVSNTLSITGSRRFGYVEVELEIDATQIPVEYQNLEEYYGYVVLTDRSDSEHRLRVPFYIIPHPYSRIQITDVEALPRAVEIELERQGPAPTDLWAFPLYERDGNEPEQADMADLRLVGLDYGFRDETFGDIFIPAINTYGPWFTPHPQFVEFDLYFDIDQDGQPDLADFNWNAGAVFGAGDDDQWVVVQVDLRTFTLSLASPYLIYTDYHSGYMEWGLPAEWHGLSETDANFDWQLFSFDSEGNRDATGVHYFSLKHPPFTFELSGPGDPMTDLFVKVRSWEGIRKSQPLGVMLVDYNGKPGEGQAHAITPEEAPFLRTLLFEAGDGTLFLPLINR